MAFQTTGCVLHGKKLRVNNNIDLKLVGEDLMKRLFFSLLVLFSVTTAAWSQSLPPEVVSYPDVIVHNGKIYTMDDKSNSANAGAVVEAVAVRDGKILLAATNKQILALRGPQTRVIDAKGRTVVPGIIDTHSHLFDYAMDSLGEGSPRLARARRAKRNLGKRETKNS